MFSEIRIQLLKCFLCARAANDAGHEATGGPPQEPTVKRLVLYTYIEVKSMDDNCGEWVECMGVASGCG